MKIVTKSKKKKLYKLNNKLNPNLIYSFFIVIFCIVMLYFVCGLRFFFLFSKQGYLDLNVQGKYKNRSFTVMRAKHLYL